jgi:hypothetical protein
MKWGRAWTFTIGSLIAIFIVMFYSGAFAPGDQVVIPENQ